MLTERVKTLEDGGQKLVQRQQQIATLRKQLKTKEDLAAEQVHQQTANIYRYTCRVWPTVNSVFFLYKFIAHSGSH